MKEFKESELELVKIMKADINDSSIIIASLLDSYNIIKDLGVESYEGMSLESLDNNEAKMFKMSQTLVRRNKKLQAEIDELLVYKVKHTDERYIKLFGEDIHSKACLELLDTLIEVKYRLVTVNKEIIEQATNNLVAIAKVKMYL